MKWILPLALCLLISGCNVLRGPDGKMGPAGPAGATGDKGDKGDKGDSGLLSSKTYTGIPNNNPYSINAVEITGADNQIVQVYLVTPSGSLKYGLPLSDTGQMHYYCLGVQYVGLTTIGLSGTPTPATALYDTAWGQCSYRIEIKTFATASIARAYMQRNSIAKSPYDQLIYGK